MAKKAEVGGRKSEVCHPPSVIRRPSSLLDTRFIYCGDWHASHYVKVMLDQAVN